MFSECVKIFKKLKIFANGNKRLLKEESGSKSVKVSLSLSCFLFQFFFSLFLCLFFLSPFCFSAFLQHRRESHLEKRDEDSLGLSEVSYLNVSSSNIHSIVFVPFQLHVGMNGNEGLSFWKEGFSNLDPIIGLHFLTNFRRVINRTYSLCKRIFLKEKEKCKSQVSVKKWSKLHEI